MEVELLSVQQVIEKFCIGRTSLYKEIAAKRIPIIKRGRRTFIARTDALAWMESLRQNSASGGGHD